MGAAPRPRFAVYGGAFDPPHNAHVSVVKALLAQFDVQRVWVVPTGRAWHKARALTDSVHRLAMARLAFGGCPKVHVDDREIRHPGPSYTVDTLAALRAEHPDADWLLLMGHDQWARFTTWHRWTELAQIAMIVVADRAESESDEAQNVVHFSAQAVPIEGVSMHPLRWTPQPLSSTAIRQGQTSPWTAVPEAVARYISEHRLYNPDHDH